MNLAWKSFKRHYLWKSLFGICLLLLVGSFLTDNFSSLGDLTGFLSMDDLSSYDGEKVKLDFYVMSQCPYGTQVEDAVAPVLEKLGDSVEFRLDFIGQVVGPDRFQSLHGQPEVDENIRQLCVQKYHPKALMDFLLCQNKDIGNAEANWEDCARNNGVNVATIMRCFGGEDGKVLLAESFSSADAVSARGSPTIFVNDQPYAGGRDTLSFQRALCLELSDHPACADMPECGMDYDCPQQEGKLSVCVDGKCAYEEPVHVDFVVLNDKECKTCDTSQIVGPTISYFPGSEVKEVDISSEEGMALVEKYGIEVVPAYLLSKSLEETKFWQIEPRVRSSFEPTVDGYKLIDAITGASHYVDEEARTAHYESLGVTLGDNKPQLDIFVMSQCPYGVSAIDALGPVVETLGDKIELNIDYIAGDNGDGTFSSLHGQPEVDENVRQLCAKSVAPDKYLNYVLCVNKNYQNAEGVWESCATDAGLDVESLKECVEGDEGKALHSESIKRSNVFGATGSPTIFVEGEAYNGGRSPEDFKLALCAAFDQAPAECETELGSSSAQPTGGC